MAVATSLSLVVGILLVFRGIRTATRGLIAAPWTPASLSLLPRGSKRATSVSVDCAAGDANVNRTQKTY